MCNNITLSQEEKFIQLIDKYITQHRDDAINAVFYRKLYDPTHVIWTQA